MRLALLLVALPALGQTVPSLRITATSMGADQVHAMFGPLKAEYGAARVDICSSDSVAVTIPLARIRQQLMSTHHVALLSSAEALQVIASAQANTKKAKILRGGVAAVQLAAIAGGWSGLSVTWKAGLNAAALVGAQSLGVLNAAATPTAMVAYSAVALPETLSFLPLGCLPNSGIQMTDNAPVGHVDFTMPIPGKVAP